MDARSSPATDRAAMPTATAAAATTDGDAASAPTNAAMDPAAEDAPRLREIPYNYTSFSDR